MRLPTRARPGIRGLLVAVPVALVAAGLGVCAVRRTRPAGDAHVRRGETPTAATSAAQEAPRPSAVADETTGAMIRIPGGRFKMGSEDGAADERPVHDVDVPSFWLDRTEVTVAAFAQCVEAGACEVQAESTWKPELSAEQCTYPQRGKGPIPGARGSHPINCVDWTNAAKFCAWAGKRLPTEREWEYAARGGSEQRLYPWGSQKPTAKLLNACGPECLAWADTQGESWAVSMYDENDGYPLTAPVGSFPDGANRWGVLDLAGNVWEWTATKRCPYPAEDCDVPARVNRGGGWLDIVPARARAAARDGSKPAIRSVLIGFRCARGGG